MVISFVYCLCWVIFSLDIKVQVRLLLEFDWITHFCLSQEVRHHDSCDLSLFVLHRIQHIFRLLKALLLHVGVIIVNLPPVQHLLSSYDPAAVFRPSPNQIFKCWYLALTYVLMMLESKRAIEARPQVYSFLRNDKSCALNAPMMIVVHGATAPAITKVLEC